MDMLCKQLAVVRHSSINIQHNTTPLALVIMDGGKMEEASSSSVTYVHPPEVSEEFLREMYNKAIVLSEEYKEVARASTADGTREVDFIAFYVLGVKPPFDNMAETSYIWKSQEDDKGKSIPASIPKHCVERTVYGLHPVDGYVGFFKPDLKQALSLASLVMTPDEARALQRFWITTSSHPSNNINESYDGAAKAHRGATRLWLEF